MWDFGPIRFRCGRSCVCFTLRTDLFFIIKVSGGCWGWRRLMNGCLRKRDGVKKTSRGRVYSHMNVFSHTLTLRLRWVPGLPEDFDDLTGGDSLLGASLAEKPWAEFPSRLMNNQWTLMCVCVCVFLPDTGDLERGTPGLLGPAVFGGIDGLDFLHSEKQ